MVLVQTALKREGGQDGLCQRNKKTWKYQRTEAGAEEQDTELYIDVSLMIANPFVSLLNVLKEIKDFTTVFRV